VPSINNDKRRLFPLPLFFQKSQFPRPVYEQGGESLRLFCPYHYYTLDYNNFKYNTGDAPLPDDNIRAVPGKIKPVFFALAQYKDHYGFFPTHSGIDKFEEELLPYRSGKGTLRFPFNKPIPWDILKKVIRYRVEENLKKPRLK
jgi:hypothetical protein